MKQCSSFPSFLAHWDVFVYCISFVYQSFFLKKYIFKSYSNGCFFDTLMIAVMKNPANLAKHQANPKVAPVITKMMNKFGGGNMWWTSLIFSVFVYNLNFEMLKWVVRICLNAWFADSWQSLLLYPFISFSSNLHSVSNIFDNCFTSFNVVGRNDQKTIKVWTYMTLSCLCYQELCLFFFPSLPTPSWIIKWL